MMSLRIKCMKQLINCNIALLSTYLRLWAMRIHTTTTIPLYRFASGLYLHSPTSKEGLIKRSVCSSEGISLAVRLGFIRKSAPNSIISTFPPALRQAASSLDLLSWAITGILSCNELRYFHVSPPLGRPDSHCCRTLGFLEELPVMKGAIWQSLHVACA